MPTTPDQIVADPRQMPADVAAEAVDRIMPDRHGLDAAPLGRGTRIAVPRRGRQIRWLSCR